MNTIQTPGRGQQSDVHCIESTNTSVISYLYFQVLLLSATFLIFLHQLHGKGLAYAFLDMKAFFTPDLPSSDQPSPLPSMFPAKILYLTLHFRTSTN